MILRRFILAAAFALQAGTALAAGVGQGILQPSIPTTNAAIAALQAQITTSVGNITPASLGVPTNAQLNTAIAAITAGGVGAATPAQVTSAVGTETGRATAAEGAEVAARQAAVAAEATARQTAIQGITVTSLGAATPPQITSAVATETTRATSAESAEVAARQAAILGITPAGIGAPTNAQLNAAVSSVSTETSRAETAETTLANSITAVAGGSVSPSQVSTAIAAETTRATTAEGSNAAAAAAAQTAASGASTTAAAAQTAASSAQAAAAAAATPAQVTSAVGTETTRATTAEGANAAAAAAAQATASAASTPTQVSTSVGTETTRATAAEGAEVTARQAAVAAEATARQTAITAITLTSLGGVTPVQVTASVSTETTRATTAEAAEVTARQAAILGITPASLGVPSNAQLNAAVTAGTTPAALATSFTCTDGTIDCAPIYAGHDYLTAGVFGATSFLTEQLNEYFTEHVLPWRFGAKCDASSPSVGTDDTAAFAAMDAYLELGSVGGRFSRGELPMNRYCLIRTLNTGNGVHWAGSGSSNSGFIHKAGTNLPFINVSSQWSTVAGAAITPQPQWLMDNLVLIDSGHGDSSYFWSDGPERKNVGTEDVKHTAAPGFYTIVAAASGFTPAKGEEWVVIVNSDNVTFNVYESFTGNNNNLGTLAGSCTIGSPCTTTDIVFEVDQDTHTGAVAAASGDRIYIKYDGAPSLYLGGASPNKTTWNNHQDVRVMLNNVRIVNSPGFAIVNDGAKFGGNIIATNLDMSNAGEGCYDAWFDYDDRIAGYQCYLNKQGGWRYFNSTDFFLIHGSTYNIIGAPAFSVTDTHSMSGRGHIWDAEINGNSNGGVYADIHSGSSLEVLGGAISKNSQKNVGSYSDFQAGPNVAADSFIIDNAEVDPPNDPNSAGSGQSSLYNFACDTPGIPNQFLITGSTQVNRTTSQIQTGCGIDWDGRNPVDGLPIPSVDLLYNGLQTGGGGGLIDLDPTTGALQLPAGGFAKRPDYGMAAEPAGAVRYNTAGCVEVSSGVSWGCLAPGPVVQSIASGTVSGAIGAAPGLTLISGNTAATSLVLPGPGPVTAANGVGSIYGVVDNDGEAATYPITISATGSAKINNSGTYTINWANGLALFMFDGTNWHALPSAAPSVAAAGPLNCAYSVVATGSNITLTDAQASCLFLDVSGTLTATVQLLYPSGAASVHRQIVENTTTAGTFSLQARVSGGGTAITVPPSASTSIGCNGATSLLCVKQ